MREALCCRPRELSHEDSLLLQKEPSIVHNRASAAWIGFAPNPCCMLVCWG